jgi:hypothetical protein
VNKLDVTFKFCKLLEFRLVGGTRPAEEGEESTVILVDHVSEVEVVRQDLVVREVSATFGTFESC